MPDEITTTNEILESPLAETPSGQNEAPQEPIQAPEPVSEPLQTLDSAGSLQATAQIEPNEPFDIAQDNPLVAAEPELFKSPHEDKPLNTESIPETEPAKTEPEVLTPTESEAQPISESVSQQTQQSTSSPTPVIIPPQNHIRELLGKARNAIQSRKRKKLDQILILLTKQKQVTNDEVEKLLHVSDSTATRYLEILEKENKIQQQGKTGKGVFYTKI